MVFGVLQRLDLYLRKQSVHIRFVEQSGVRRQRIGRAAGGAEHAGEVGLVVIPAERSEGRNDAGRLVRMMTEFSLSAAAGGRSP